MDDGAGDAEEVAALAAVWGRAASASAPPSPRPELDELFAPPEAAAGPPPPRRRAPALAALAVVVAGAVVAAVVLLGGDDPRVDPGPEVRPSTTTTTGPAGGPPAWTAAVVCPRFEDGTGGGRTACLLATDDERAYVLVDAAGTPSLRALDAGTGQVRWEAPFPEGARTLQRLASVVVVGGVGFRPATAEAPVTWGEAVALDPATGERLWSRPGTVVAPAGRDHLVVDETLPSSDREAMAVVEAATGREVLRREADGVPVHIHPCGSLVLVSEGDRLTAHDVADGWPRWSIPAPHRDAFGPVRCDDRRIAYVDHDSLVLLDAGTAASIGGARVTPGEDASSQVLAVVGDTVVVGSIDGARGFRAGADGVEELWHLPCTECGPELLAGGTPIGEGGYGEQDVVVVIGGEAVVRDAADGSAGPRLALDGGTRKVLADGVLVAWDGEAVTWAAPVGLGAPVRIAAEGVRTVAAGSAHVVVATDDEVRAHLRGR